MKARKVMILDDDPLILTLLGCIFHRRGYEVVTYSNPTECPHYSNVSCECLVEEPCASVIITDYDMPFVNGLEFIEGLRKKGCRCPHMAMVTGYGLAQDIINRVAKLGVRFFTKPFHRNQIIDWLDQIEPTLFSGEAS